MAFSAASNRSERVLVGATRALHSRARGTNARGRQDQLVYGVHDRLTTWRMARVARGWNVAMQRLRMGWNSATRFRVIERDLGPDLVERLKPMSCSSRGGRHRGYIGRSRIRNVGLWSAIEREV